MKGERMTGKKIEETPLAAGTTTAESVVFSPMLAVVSLGMLAFSGIKFHLIQAHF
jgi:hypothetical protein